MVAFFFAPAASNWLRFSYVGSFQQIACECTGCDTTVHDPIASRIFLSSFFSMAAGFRPRHPT